jgi:hypothetical protein
VGVPHFLLLVALATLPAPLAAGTEWVREGAGEQRGKSRCGCGWIAGMILSSPGEIEPGSTTTSPRMPTWPSSTWTPTGRFNSSTPVLRRRWIGSGGGGTTGSSSRAPPTGSSKTIRGWGTSLPLPPPNPWTSHGSVTPGLKGGGICNGWAGRYTRIPTWPWTNMWPPWFPTGSTCPTPWTSPATTWDGSTSIPVSCAMTVTGSVPGPPGTPTFPPAWTSGWWCTTTPTTTRRIATAAPRWCSCALRHRGSPASRSRRGVGGSRRPR